MKTQHTQTPWEFTPEKLYHNEHVAGRGPIIYGPNGGGAICRTSDFVCSRERGEAEANAAFIVRACNNFDDLVAALQKAVDFVAYAADDLNLRGREQAVEAYSILELVRVVLARAKGEA